MTTISQADFNMIFWSLFAYCITIGIAFEFIQWLEDYEENAVTLNALLIALFWPLFAPMYIGILLFRLIIALVSF